MVSGPSGLGSDSGARLIDKNHSQHGRDVDHDKLSAQMLSMSNVLYTLVAETREKVRRRDR